MPTSPTLEREVRVHDADPVVRTANGYGRQSIWITARAGDTAVRLFFKDLAAYAAFVKQADNLLQSLVQTEQPEVAER